MVTESATPSPWEVEQKYRVEDHRAILDSLRSWNAPLVSHEEQVDTYLRHPCRDFRATDEALRVRTTKGCSWVTYKGPRLPGPVKTRPELELPLGEGSESNWLQLFRSLGFVVAAQVRKERHSYALKENSIGFTIALDRVESIGCFVEIERIVTNLDERTDAQQQIEDLARKLKLAEVESRSYLGMILAQSTQPL